jgi:hypothetical protein
LAGSVTFYPTLFSLKTACKLKVASGYVFVSKEILELLSRYGWLSKIFDFEKREEKKRWQKREIYAEDITSLLAAFA